MHKDQDILVSVSVVTYQHQAYIKRCLDSILCQNTSFKFEVLLGEDDSTDGTREICKEYAAKYPTDIRLFLNDEKDKISIDGMITERANLLNNFKKAKGKYMAIMDGDDWWTDPYKLQKQVDFMEANPECSLICHDTQNRKAAKGWYGLERLFKASFLPHTSNYLMKKEVANADEPLYKIFRRADLLFLFLATRYGKIFHSDEIVSEYTENANGIWSGMSQKDQLHSVLREMYKVKKHFGIPFILFYRKVLRLKIRINQLSHKKDPILKLYARVAGING